MDPFDVNGYHMMQQAYNGYFPGQQPDGSAEFGEPGTHPNGIHTPTSQIEHSEPPISGAYTLLSSALVSPHRYPIATSMFDTKEELLWTGNAGGYVTSYYGPTSTKYTAYRASLTAEIRCIHTAERGILALSESSLKFNTRHGLCITEYTAPNFTDMQCLLDPSAYSGSDPDSGSIIVGGHHQTLVQIDLGRMEQVKEYTIAESGCAIFRSNDKFIFSGDTSGRIAIRRKDTLEAVNSIQAHSGTLSDFDVCGNKLITCGFSTRTVSTAASCAAQQETTMSCDRFLSVYDLRTMRALPPLSIPFDPMLLRFSSPYTESQLVVASQVGQFQLLEIGAPTNLDNLFQIANRGAALICMDISASKQAVAFGDTGGFIHSYGTSSSVTQNTLDFNATSRPTEFADPPTVYPPMAIDDHYTPLSVIPLHKLTSPNDGWASDWPEHLTRRVYRVPKPIDPAILASMRQVQYVGYAPNPKTTRRNQVPYDLTQEEDVKPSQSGLAYKHTSPDRDSRASHRFGIPRGSPAFNGGGGSHTGSPMRPGGHHSRNDHLDTPGGHSGIDPTLLSNSGYPLPSLIPRIYRHYPTKPAKIMSDDWDYRSSGLNRTGTYSGIEFSLPNAYVNAVMLVLYHMASVRRAMASHWCKREFCLTCEAGFLFDMCRAAGGRVPVLSANLIRAFRTIPEASALGLVLNDRLDLASQKPDLGHLIQCFHRFVIRQLILGLGCSQALSKPNGASDPEQSGNRVEESVSSLPDTPSATQWATDTDTPPRDDKVVEPAPIKARTDSNVFDETAADSKITEASTDSSTLDNSTATANSTGERLSSVGNRRNRTAVDDLFGFETMNCAECIKCGHLTRRADSSIVVPLSYPEPDELMELQQAAAASTEDKIKDSTPVGTNSELKSSGDEATPQIYSNNGGAIPFTKILERSLRSEKQIQSWCEKCSRFQSTRHIRSLVSVPNVLTLSCRIETQEDKAFWDAQLLLAAKSGYKPLPHQHQSDNQPTETPIRSENSVSPTPPTMRGIKYCRYGSKCTRPNCHFRHGNEEPEGFCRAGQSWVPTRITINLPENSNGDRGVLVEGVVAEDDDLDNEDNAACRSDETTLKDPTGATEDTQRLTKTYRLTAVVCAIKDVEKDGEGAIPHLITCVKVPSVMMDTRLSGTSTPDRISGRDVSTPRKLTVNAADDESRACHSPIHHEDDLKTRNWIVYNDVMVSYVDTWEVTHFSMDWKIPCLLYYSSIQDDIAFQTWEAENTSMVMVKEAALFREESLALRRRLSSSSCVPLDAEEIPKRGDLVAIDAEFVILNQEEAELRSDGSRSTIKASQMSVARVTCIRGSGSLEGTPFIDDYIATQDEIADYKTDKSGIKPGDLDVELSSKHLTTLKTTYLKLRYLADSGVIFVGHGLKNDFRMINMVVPPEQIIDTVQLYHLPHQRMVSLRFLAWHYFGLNIQSDSHDSIEDALAALRLYRKFIELSTNMDPGDQPTNFRRSLTEMYDKGRKYKWKVPGSD